MAITAVKLATIRLFWSALWITVSPRTLAYHRRLRPCQSVTRWFVPLKLNTTTITIGKYRKR